MKTRKSITLIFLTSLLVFVVGCVSNNVRPPIEKPQIFDIDSSSRHIKPFVDPDDETFEIRFENADFLDVVDALNKLSEKFTVVAASAPIIQDKSTLKADVETDQTPIESQTVTGFFSGTYREIIRDVCVTAGYYSDRLDDHFYISRSPVELSLIAVSTVVETSLQKEDLDQLKGTFGNDVEYTLISSKLLISGRFYAVKRFREYVEQLNEVKRSYVARLVFVRLERSSISRIEAELKTSQLDLISQGYDLYSLFESQLDVKFSRDRSYNYSEQLIYCSDGQRSQLKIGSTFSREQRAVSDYGTSTTTGYQQFEDGVDVELTPYRSLNGVVELQLRFGNSKFSDVSNLAKNQVDLTYERLTLEENKLYYVASLTENNSGVTAKFLGLSNSADNKILTCWIVVSPVRSSKPMTVGESF